MRTPEQISNLRRVLFMRVGPYANFLSDDDIEEFANNLQKRIDQEKFYWNIKVKHRRNADWPWEEIESEPTAPHCSVNQIKKSCESLLKKYPKIWQLRVCVLMHKKEVNIMVFNQTSF